MLFGSEEPTEAYVEASRRSAYSVGMANECTGRRQPPVVQARHTATNTPAPEEPEFNRPATQNTPGRDDRTGVSGTA